MRLLLIRHGETVDNVAGIYAGTTDSALTNHGVLQANSLGAHLATTDVKISHIFSSDLQRAVKTAEAIRTAQSSPPKEVKKSQLIREQDFGFYEGKPFSQHSLKHKGRTESLLQSHRNGPRFKDVESKQSMMIRVNTFIDAHLLPVIDEGLAEGLAVVVVAHGVVLNHLWGGILKRFHARDVTVVPSALASSRMLSLEYLGSWTNTGYLELELKPKPASPSPEPGPSSKRNRASNDITEPSLPTRQSSQAKANNSAPHHAPHPLRVNPIISTNALALPPQVLNMSLVVKAVNCQDHLKGLKKTRGGIGSLKHDSSQKTVDNFFKKQKKE